MAEFLTETWLKLLAAVFSALAAVLVWLNTWRKEDARYADDRAATRDAIPAIMSGLAATGTPMAALMVDRENNFMHAAERLTHVMERLSTVIDRQIGTTERNAEETRRAAGVIERQAEEARRLNEKIADLTETLSRERHRAP